jgi:hypothetical protein
MGTTTSNFNLIKPAREDFYNIADQNSNMDIIDGELKNVKNAIVEHNHDGRYETTGGAQAKADSAQAAAKNYTDQREGSIRTELAKHITDYIRQPGYNLVTGNANTYSIILAPAPASYVEGMGVTIKISATNTGASTLNVNGLGARPIIDGRGNVLKANKLLLGRIYSLRYDGANFQLQGEGGEMPKLVNLCKNGSFENDFNSFIVSGAAPMMTSGAYIGNKCLKTTSSSSSASYVYQNSLYIPNMHKVYVTGMVNIESYTSGEKASLVLYQDGTFNIIQGGYANTSIIGSWQRVSFVTTMNVNNARLLVGRGDIGIESSRIDAVMVIDLTAAFGAGNEPSKEEVDAMVTQSGINVFDYTAASTLNYHAAHTLVTSGFRVASTTVGSWSQIRKLAYVKPNTTYSLSFDLSVSSGTGCIVIRNGSLSKVFVSSAVTYTTNGRKTTASFTSDGEGAIAIDFHCTAASSSSGDVTYSNIILSESQTDYVPYWPFGWWDSDLQKLTSDSTAEFQDILSGKVAYSNGWRAVGLMPDHSGNNINASVVSSINGQVRLGIPQGYYDGLYSVLANDSNFVPANIVNGISIFGLTGTNTNKKWQSGSYIYPYALPQGTQNFSIPVNLPFIPNYVIINVYADPSGYLSAGCFDRSTGMSSQPPSYSGGLLFIPTGATATAITGSAEYGSNGVWEANRITLYWRVFE